MVNPKAISSMIAIISLVLLVMGLSGSFLFWNVATSETFKTTVQSETQRVISPASTGFEIVDVDFVAKTIKIKNSGYNVIDSDHIYIFLNGSLSDTSADKTEINPGEILTLTLTDSIVDYDIMVTGPHETSDEFYTGGISCGNGVVEFGEECDDGNLIDCDSCHSDCTSNTGCGDGYTCHPEECDDGNTDPGDGCDENCMNEVLLFCSDCASCTATINSANPGDMIYLDLNINNQDGNCIEFNGTDNITFDCQGHTIDGDGDYPFFEYGIYLSALNGGSNNNTIKNCKIQEFYDGIRLNRSSGNNITNIIVNHNVHGIQNTRSNNFVLNNIFTYENMYGIQSVNGGNNTVLNNITADLNQYGVYVDFSYSNLTNIYCSNSNAYGFTFFGNNSNIKNITSNFNTDGIWILHAENNSFENITSSFNINDGLILFWGADYNTIKNSRIENNSGTGIKLSFRSFDIGLNKIYDNIFNNSVNIYFEDSIIPNYWNTTQTSGPNIVGGPDIGGNYWGRPDGTGFSDTCSDSDTDGFCDSDLNITNMMPCSGASCSSNTDWLPLTKRCGTDGIYLYGICWQPGGFEQNCTTVCSNYGLTCYDPDWSQVAEDCSLHAAFGWTCSQCNLRPDPPDPSQRTDNNWCYYTQPSNNFECNGWGNSLRRICPCQ